MRSLPGLSAKPVLPLGVCPAWRAAGDRPRAASSRLGDQARVAPRRLLSVSAWRAAGDTPHAVSSRYVGQARAAPQRSPSLAGSRQQTPCRLFQVHLPSRSRRISSPDLRMKPAASLFRLLSRHVSLTLSWTWPAEL